ncbi:MAG: exodeoxyribonuclease VII large subunit [Firmicutes bacterium]|nr:exodeoxyribonuclease VII large subunit [Bacillota bacterium]
MQPKILEVSEVTQYVKAKLEEDDFLLHIGVRGEISNFKHHSSGHMYFTLKDQGSTLRCVMFRGQSGRLQFTPQDGMQVVALGSIGVYGKGGVYQLYVQAMEPAGLGSLHLAFLELKERLEKEGLFAMERKRELPLLPRQVGIITSKTGAAIRDIITVSRRRFPNIDLIVAPVLVQGERAAPQMVASLAALAQVPAVDVIILARGGGSWEDLWAFNDEDLVRAIVSCPVPVITAVGHETDYPLVDFAADVRAPTPSAAAELAVPSREKLQYNLRVLKMQSLQGMRKVLEKKQRLLQELSMRRPFAAPEAFFNDQRQLVDGYLRNLEYAISRRLQEWRTALSLLGGRLDSLSPLSVLQRGYSVVFDEEGSIVRRAEKVKVGTRLWIKPAQGQLRCKVEEVKEEDGRG